MKNNGLLIASSSSDSPFAGKKKEIHQFSMKGSPLPGIDKDMITVTNYHGPGLKVLKSSKHQNCLLSLGFIKS